MEPDDLLCSRNARVRTPLVGRAQGRSSASIPEEVTNDLGGIICSFVQQPQLRLTTPSSIGRVAVRKGLFYRNTRYTTAQ